MKKIKNDKKICVKFEILGSEELVTKCKIVVNNEEKECDYISDLLNKYAKVKYGAYLDWDDYYDAYLVIEGIRFKLEKVTKYTADDEQNEIFEYRKETLINIIKECTNEIDKVYKRESVKNVEVFCF